MNQNSDRTPSGKQRVRVASVRPPQASTGKAVHVAPVEDDGVYRSRILPRSEHPLEKARRSFADDFDEILNKAWRLGMHDLSARVIARRWIQRPNELVSKWRTNKKPMPAAALLLLPEYVLVELINVVLRARGMKGYEP